MKATINTITIEVLQENILALPVDIIVTGTDPNLTLSPSLAAAGGASLQTAVSDVGWCDIGSAVITSSGDLNPAKFVIHAVGPRWGEGSERGKLARLVWESLGLAEAFEQDSIAFPAISIGKLGYPVENCAQVMLSRIIDFTFEPVRYLKEIVLCLESPHTHTVFAEEFVRQIDDLRQSGEAAVTG